LILSSALIITILLNPGLVFLLLASLSIYPAYKANFAISQVNSPATNNVSTIGSDIASENNRNGTIENPYSLILRDLPNSGIDVNTFPVGIAVNPNTGKVYVANEFSNTVSVIDTETDKVKSTIDAGDFPYGVDTNPLNNRVYVTNRGSNTVSVIDGSIDSKLLDIHVGKSPVGIAVNPTANWIYVTNLNDGTLSVIDGITNGVIDTIPVGKAPYSVAVNPLTNTLYVSDIVTNTISVINGETNSVTDKITVGKRPTGLTIDITKGSNKLYVANYDSNSVSVIDTTSNEVIDNIASFGDSPVGIAIDSLSNKLYVSNIASNTVSVIDTKAISIDNSKNKTNSGLGSLPDAPNNDTGVIIKEISVNPTLRESYSGEDSLVNLPNSVGFPLLASHVTINPYEKRIYTTNTGSNTITVINGESNEVTVRLTFNVNPSNAGDIQCNGIRNSSGNSSSYDRGQVLECLALPERGYAFSSWSGVANERNANPLKLRVSSFGTLNANFHSALTPEVYIFAIVGIVGTTSVFVGWYYKYGQRRYVKRYLTRIQSTYDTLHEKDVQQCISQLHGIRRELIYLFKRGSLSDSHYNILDKKVLDYIETVRNEREGKDL
jgi:YVTN family beta-propeller protein